MPRHVSVLLFFFKSPTENSSQKQKRSKLISTGMPIYKAGHKIHAWSNVQQYAAAAATAVTATPSLSLPRLTINRTCVLITGQKARRVAKNPSLCKVYVVTPPVDHDDKNAPRIGPLASSDHGPDLPNKSFHRPFFGGLGSLVHNFGRFATCTVMSSGAARRLPPLVGSVLVSN